MVCLDLETPITATGFSCSKCGQPATVDAGHGIWLCEPCSRAGLQRLRRVVMHTGPRCSNCGEPVDRPGRCSECQRDAGYPTAGALLIRAYDNDPEQFINLYQSFGSRIQGAVTSAIATELNVSADEVVW